MMRLDVTTAPASLPVTWPMMRKHLNLTDDRRESLVMDYVTEATAYAEEKMQCSLVTRTITAVYDACDEIILKRGPIIAITSVTDAFGAAIASWTRSDVGNSTVLSSSTPIRTVVYQAGFDTVPSDLVGKIRVHAATLFLVREDVVIGGSVSSVHRLDDYYRFRSRGSVVA